MFIARVLVSTFLALLATSPTARSTELPHRSVNIVLVHGALIDGSSWRGVFDVLRRDGYRVRVVQLPLTGFEEDVAATVRLMEPLEGPIVLVGHSYGGSIITHVGGDSRVKALVYVAALQPDVGETSAEVAPPKPQAAVALEITPDAVVYLEPEGFIAELGQELPKDTARFMAYAQKPIKGSAFSAKLTQAA